MAIQPVIVHESNCIVRNMKKRDFMFVFVSVCAYLCVSKGTCNNCFFGHVLEKLGVKAKVLCNIYHYYFQGPSLSSILACDWSGVCSSVLQFVSYWFMSINPPFCLCMIG